MSAFAYKIASNHVNPFIITTVVACFYMLITPLAFIFLNFDRTINLPGVSYALLGGAFACIGSLGLFFALQKGPAGEVAVLTALYPAITMALSCLFLGETFTVKKGIGIILAVISFVILASK